MEKKKEFERPELTIVTFVDDDIIVCSGGYGVNCALDPDDEYCID